MPGVDANARCPWCGEFMTLHQDGRGTFRPCAEWVSWAAYYRERRPRRSTFDTPPFALGI